MNVRNIRWLLCETRKRLIRKTTAQLAQGTSGGANPYKASSNHCFTFAMEVANSAGVQTNVGDAEYLDIKIASKGFGVFASIAGAFTPNFEVPSRQLRKLQEKYAKLNISKLGAPVGNFEFPNKLY